MQEGKQRIKFETMICEQNVEKISGGGKAPLGIPVEDNHENKNFNREPPQLTPWMDSTDN